MRSPRVRRPIGFRLRPSQPLIFGVAAVAAVSATGTPVSAALLSWNNLTGGLISTAGNWSPVQVPGAGDDLVFNLVDTFPLTFNNIVPASNSLIWNEGVVTVTATSPHTAANGIIIGDVSGDNPTLTLTTGTMTSTPTPSSATRAVPAACSTSTTTTPTSSSATRRT